MPTRTRTESKASLIGGAVEQRVAAGERRWQAERRSLLNAVFGGPQGERGADDMDSHGIPEEEWRRIQNLRCDIVNRAYEENYEASDLAAQELVALIEGLESKYGHLPALLAVHADYVPTSRERERLLHALFEEAQHRQELLHRAWATYQLAAHYVDVEEDDRRGHFWLSRAEANADLLADELAQEGLARLRGILSARQRRSTAGSGGPPNNRMQLTKSAPRHRGRRRLRS